MNQSYVDVPTRYIRTSDGEKYAYRDMDNQSGIPIIALNHLSANLDNWNPMMIDGLAEKHRVITFDYKGVGQTSGKVPLSIKQMAIDTILFISALDLKKVVLLGFSMGGMVAQELLSMKPEIVEKVILAGTGPRGGEGITRVTKISDLALIKALMSFKDVKTYLFFTRTQNGRNEARKFLTRIKLRQKQRDQTISWSAYRRQLRAINHWGTGDAIDFSTVRQPVLVINGDHDIMVPTKPNTYDLHDGFSNSQLIIYPDAGHGSIAQNYQDFAKQVNNFL